MYQLLLSPTGVGTYRTRAGPRPKVHLSGPQHPLRAAVWQCAPPSPRSWGAGMRTEEVTGVHAWPSGPRQAGGWREEGELATRGWDSQDAPVLRGG